MNVYINNSLSVHGSLDSKAERPTSFADPLQSSIDAEKPSSTPPCEPSWQQLIEQIRKDSPSPIESKNNLNGIETELTPEQLQRYHALIQLLHSWDEEGDEQEQRETWEYLKKALDEDRL